MSKSSKVPSGRISRLGKLTGLAAKLAGSAISTGAGQLLKAQKPSLKSTVFTTNNALSISSKLAQMRGAAMKIGQMLSMDAGEFLPAEWEPILAQLRQGADAMPKSQLLNVLNKNWGPNWMDKFEYFSFEPVAAASIGQVHRARLKSGDDLAIKVQYPGVAQSIDSDINNVGRLIKLSGALPPEVNLDKILEQAKIQLKREADYRQEYQFLQRFAQLVKDDDNFIVPDVNTALSGEYILAMTYIQGEPLDKVENFDQQTIDHVCHCLMTLTLKELFAFGFMQSDPNFANYFYQADTQKIVLLDFGACCDIAFDTQTYYKKMAQAMQQQDQQMMKQAFFDLGLLHPNMPNDVIEMVLSATLMASECLQTETYNFKASALVSRLYAHTQGLIRNKKAIASPNFDTALVNRKISGMILLANRLGAKLEMRKALAPYLREKD
ncbi:ABC1 kinase family protein [Glaciecola sp. 1036]|uniref:ABC1 kinase family protein n=1 Tax=Alteromonadaceae TaxID=72275 RepID=UPI003D003AAB